MADPTTAPATDLLALRQQIDAVDRELLALLNRRAAIALHVGELKKKEGSVVFRPEREAQVIDGLKAANPGPLLTESVAPIWREIMSACRSLETPTRVAYLGPAGTFSELAALGYFGSNPWAFVILSGIVFLAWGEVYSLFSATAADTFGSKHIGKIYGVLYCAKGLAALFVPVGNLLMQATGTWSSVLYTVAIMDLIAATLAITMLRPMLKKHHASNGVMNPVAAGH